MKNAEPPHCAMDPDVDGQLRLSGSWTLSTALQSAQVLGGIHAQVRGMDARGIDQLDSAGVLQLLRYSRSAGLRDDALLFREEHRALVCTIAWRLFHTANVAEKPRTTALHWWFAPLLGAFSGAAGGATGTGGGLVLVPLALQTGLATNKNATAISNMVMVLVAAMGTIAHLRAIPTLSVPWTVGHINFQVVPAVFLGAQVGSMIGRHYDHRLSLRARRITLAVLLLLIVASLLPRFM